MVTTQICDRPTINETRRLQRLNRHRSCYTSHRMTGVSQSSSMQTSSACSSTQSSFRVFKRRIQHTFLCIISFNTKTLKNVADQQNKPKKRYLLSVSCSVNTASLGISHKSANGSPSVLVLTQQIHPRLVILIFTVSNERKSSP